jgi:3-deoxy-manno-octulosonate cytidylyltransferase (CMP-KDO synthetase)
MAAARLPDKPLLDINGKSLIRRVYENCRAALSGDIVIAAGDQAIADECERFGARAVLTDPALPSGTDRAAAALAKIDPSGSEYDIVVDFQGDNVNVDPRVNMPLIEMAARADCDIATCAMVMDPKDAGDPNLVKVCMGVRGGGLESRALYFTRAAAPFVRDPGRPGVDENYYLHIGVYVFKADVLRQCALLPLGTLEDREKLEQLRWLENGLAIRARVVDSVKLVPRAPQDINTLEEFEEAKKWIK